MKHKLEEQLGLLLIVLVFAGLVWLRPGQRSLGHPSGQDQLSTATPGLEVSPSEAAQVSTATPGLEVSPSEDVQMSTATPGLEVSPSEDAQMSTATPGLEVSPSEDAQMSTATPGLEVNPSDDAQMIKDTILQAVRIYIEAAYTFDISQLAMVYTNDKRGGEVSDRALAAVREFRQDPSLQKDQVGELVIKQTDIEARKRNYDQYMANLQAKAASGSLSDDEKFILEGEANGWPTPTPDPAGPGPTPTLSCSSASLLAGTPVVAYPGPYNYWHPNPYLGPTQLPEAVVYPPPVTQPPPTATVEPPDPSQSSGCPPLTLPDPFALLYLADGRGINPVLLPPEVFQVDIKSIEMDGDVAWAVVAKPGLRYEQMLVKIDGQWYLGGSVKLSYYR